MNIPSLFPAGSAAPLRWLGFLRVGVALTIMFKIISEWSYAGLLYGRAGVVQELISEALLNPLTPALHHLLHLFPASAGDHWLIYGFLSLNFAAAVLLLLDIGTVGAALLCWLCHLLVFNNSPLTTYGVDSFLLTLTFYTFLFHVIFSSRQRRGEAGADGQLVRLSLGLLRFHLCVVYFIAGISKLRGATWLSGEAVWHAVTQPQFYTFATPLIMPVLTLPMVVPLLTWGTLAAEISYPVLIWIRPLRRLVFGSIILMHLFIGVVLGLKLFAWTMIVFNVAAFGTAILPAGRSSGAEQPVVATA